MPRSVADARLDAARHGAVHEPNGLGDRALGEPSALPGWSRRHVLAHVAANADALGNLVCWAATGKPTPTYASPADRAAGFERGRQQPARDLTAWLHRSADALEEEMTRLSDEQWQAPVLTAQGRTVPATEVPWMHSREVYVHAVDLATGLSAGLSASSPRCATTWPINAAMVAARHWRWRLPTPAGNGSCPAPARPSPWPARWPRSPHT
jgi:uncharacterized protein (TIGR03083 family)